METKIVWGACVHTDGSIEKSTHCTFEDEKEMWNYYDAMRVIEGADISVNIYNLSIIIGREYVPVQEYRIAKGHYTKPEDREVCPNCESTHPKDLAYHCVENCLGCYACCNCVETNEGVA